MEEDKTVLLIQYKFLIKLMHQYDGTQCHNTPMKLYADVFNPERNRIKQELEKLGVTEYKCDIGNTHMLHQICSCKK